MTDLATLGLRFENEGLDAQNRGLDQLTEKSARAQKATDALAGGHKLAAGQMLASGQMQAAVFKGVETQAHVSSLAIRESLVLMREASVGNFTRMAGSASLLAQSLSTSGTSLGGFIKALLTMTGVIKTTSDAELTADAAAAAGAAGAIQARLNQAQANILAADTEYALAKAQLQVAGTAEAQVAARAALTAANEASTAAALEATIAETALATANTAAAETATAAAAAETMALAPLGAALAIIAAVLAPVVAGFALFNRELSKGYPDDITKGLGLTEAQLARVKDKTVTFGDTFMATFTVIGRHIMSGPVGKGLHWLGDKFGEAMDFITRIGFKATVDVVAFFIAAAKTIGQNWRGFGDVIGAAIATAVNHTISGIELMVNAAVAGLNKVIEGANKLPGVHLGAVSGISIPRMAVPEGHGNIATSFQANYEAAKASVSEGLKAFGAEVAAEAIRRATERAKKEAGKGAKGNASDHTGQRGDQIDQMIAQAKAEELQAQLALTHDLNARAVIEKQVIDAQLAVKTAQIDRMEKEIESDKTVDKTQKPVLIAQLEGVKLVQAHIAVLQKQKVDDDTALALRAQEMDQLKTAADLQQRILNAQLGMATTYADRAIIEQRIFDAKQAQEKLEFDYIEALKLRNQQITPEQDAANRADFAKAQAGDASVFGRNQYLDAHPVQKWLEQVGDATDRTRQRGELMVQTFDSLASSLSDAIVNAKNLGDATKSVFRQMLQDMLTASLKALEGSLMKTAGSAFLHYLPGFATGTNYAPGGMAIVGEKGPEVVNLPRGSQVIPNDALRGSNDNARSPIVFDMRGAVVTEDLLNQMNQIAANGDAQVAQYADDRARQHAAVARAGAAKDAVRAMPSAQRSYAKLGSVR
jgi:hypothetical protein